MEVSNVSQQIVALFFISSVLLCISGFVITVLIAVFKHTRVLNRARKVKVRNPLVKDTFTNRIMESVCHYEGCVTTASYYVGMPQATCKRCGHKNHCTQPGVPEWRLPDHCEK